MWIELACAGWCVWQPPATCGTWTALIQSRLLKSISTFIVKGSDRQEVGGGRSVGIALRRWLSLLWFYPVGCCERVSAPGRLRKEEKEKNKSADLGVTAQSCPRQHTERAERRQQQQQWIPRLRWASPPFHQLEREPVCFHFQVDGILMCSAVYIYWLAVCGTFVAL